CEWGLSDDAGDGADVIGGRRTREPVAQWAPHRDKGAGPESRQQPGELTDDDVHDVDARRSALRVEVRIVEGERPAQEWIGAGRQTQHYELPGSNEGGDVGRFQPDQVSIAC